jgi:hypothetical protein
MEVEVGSFSDPEGLEGLAHFLGEFVLSLSLSLSLCAHPVRWLPALRLIRFVTCACAD